VAFCQLKRCKKFLRQTTNALVNLDMNKSQNTERAVHSRVRRIRTRLSRLRRQTTNEREATRQSNGERTLRRLMPEMNLLEAMNNALPKR